MERNTIKEMREILDAIEQGKYVQFTYDGVNWNDADRCFKPYTPDFMHNKYRIKPEEPKKKWRPCKNVDEFIQAAGGLGAIWVKLKDGGRLQQVTAIDYKDSTCAIRLPTMWVNFKELFKLATFADGTPCGVEEDA